MLQLRHGQPGHVLRRWARCARPWRRTGRGVARPLPGRHAGLRPHRASWSSKAAFENAVRSYYSVQQVHARYAQQTAASIRYADGQGTCWTPVRPWPTRRVSPLAGGHALCRRAGSVRQRPPDRGVEHCRQITSAAQRLVRARVDRANRSRLTVPWWTAIAPTMSIRRPTCMPTDAGQLTRFPKATCQRVSWWPVTSRDGRARVVWAGREPGPGHVTRGRAADRGRARRGRQAAWATATTRLSRGIVYVHAGVRRRQLLAHSDRALRARRSRATGRSGPGRDSDAGPWGYCGATFHTTRPWAGSTGTKWTASGLTSRSCAARDTRAHTNRRWL